MALALTITNAGRAALRNQDGSGTRAVRIATVGVSATAIQPAATAAALPGEIKRIATLSGDAVAADIIHLVVRDETMATYTVRSFALYLDDGTLFALHGQPDPIFEKSAQALMLLALDITLADITASQITFGDTSFLLPPATVERAGVIELATVAEARAGEDTARGVTPATARAAVRDWIGYTPANRAGDTFTGAVNIRYQGTEAGLRVAVGDAGAGLIQFGNAAASLTNWHMGSLGQGTFALYQGTPNANALRLSVTSVTIAYNGAVMWHAGNDGAGSGLDADLLDGRQSEEFALLTGASFSGPVSGQTPNASTTGGFRLRGNPVTGRAYFQVTSADLLAEWGNLAFDAGGGIWWRGNPVWHAGNDGAGSGMDADLLDGRQADEFALRAAGSFTAPVNVYHPDLGVGLRVGAVNTGYGLIQYGDASNANVLLNWHMGSIGNGTFALFQGTPASNVLRLAVTSTTVAYNGAVMWHAGNDGAGSGLDADLLDGRQAADFALLAGADFTGPVTVRHPDLGVGFRVGSVNSGYGIIQYGDASNANALLNWHAGSLGNGTFAIFQGTPASNVLRLAVTSTTVTYNGVVMWHAGNDGAGSGLDADLLDGRHASEFALAGAGDFTAPVNVYHPDLGIGLRVGAVNTGYGLIQYGNASNANVSLNWHMGSLGTGTFALFQGPLGSAAQRLAVTSSTIVFNGAVMWHAGNDGAGSGLDADLLDGRQAAEFALLAGAIFGGRVGRDELFHLDLFGTLAQLVMGDGARLAFDRQNRIFDVRLGTRTPLLLTETGATIGEGLSLTRANAGRYVHYADGAIAGDTITRSTAAPSGGTDGDTHYQVDTTAGSLRIWHNYAGTWVHT